MIPFPTLRQFPALLNFLSAYLSERDIENRTEEQAIQYFLSVTPLNEIILTIEEGKKLLNKLFFPWKEVSSAANRYLSNKQEAREWLTKIMKILEEELKKRKLTSYLK